MPLPAYVKLPGARTGHHEMMPGARMRAFLDDPVNQAIRVQHAATQTGDPDLALQGRTAQAFGSGVVRFNSEVLIRGQSPTTRKVKYSSLTDIDVEVAKAIIEVTTQSSAS